MNQESCGMRAVAAIFPEEQRKHWTLFSIQFKIYFADQDQL
jgi:hypothetical protein